MSSDKTTPTFEYVSAKVKEAESLEGTVDPDADESIRQPILDEEMEHRREEYIQREFDEEANLRRFEAACVGVREKEAIQREKERAEEAKEEERRRKEYLRFKRDAEKLMEPTAAMRKRIRIQEAYAKTKIGQVVERRKGLVEEVEQLTATRDERKHDFETIKDQKAFKYHVAKRTLPVFQKRLEEKQKELDEFDKTEPEAKQWMEEFQQLKFEQRLEYVLAKEKGHKVELKISAPTKEKKEEHQRVYASAAALEKKEEDEGDEIEEGEALAPMTAVALPDKDMDETKDETKDEDGWTLEKVFLACYYRDTQPKTLPRIKASELYDEYVGWARGCGYTNILANGRGKRDGFNVQIKKYNWLAPANRNKILIWDLAGLGKLPKAPEVFRGKNTRRVQPVAETVLNPDADLEQRLHKLDDFLQDELNKQIAEMPVAERSTKCKAVEIVLKVSLVCTCVSVLKWIHLQT